jgi:hypothetical protein
VDNWFSSPDLFHKLYSKEMDAVGTLHLNRKGVPNETQNALLKKGGHASVYKT